MPIVIVDASAVAAVLLGESQATEVARRLRKVTPTAPTLLRYEIGHACLKKLVRYPKRRAALLESLSLFIRMQIEEIEVPPSDVLELAESAKLSFYDASYLWLSRALGAPLITLDSKLAQAASQL